MPPVSYIETYCPSRQNREATLNYPHITESRSRNLEAHGRGQSLELWWRLSMCESEYAHYGSVWKADSMGGYSFWWT